MRKCERSGKNERERNANKIRSPKKHVNTFLIKDSALQVFGLELGE